MLLTKLEKGNVFKYRNINMNMRGDRKEHHFLVNVLLLTIVLFLFTTFVFGYGTNLGPINMGHSANEVSGTVVGGAFALYLGDGECSDSWGEANCVTNYGQTALICPDGSTKRITGKNPYNNKDVYLCIKN